MRKRTITFGLLLLAVVLTAASVSGTYARYTTSDTGIGTATVAEWAVSFEDTEENELEQGFNLQLDQEDNTYVVGGLIAPAASVYKDVVINLTDTQVATDIVATLNSVTGVQGSPSRFHTTLSVVNPTSAVTGLTTTTDSNTGVTTINVGLDNNRAQLVAEKITIRVSLVWDNVEESNTDDTTMGVAAGDIVANLTLTAKQHIAADDPTI